MSLEQVTIQASEQPVSLRDSANDIWGRVSQQMVDEAKAREICDIQELSPDAARAAGSELAALILEQTIVSVRGPEEILQDRLYNLLEKVEIPNDRI